MLMVEFDEWVRKRRRGRNLEQFYKFMNQKYGPSYNSVKDLMTALAYQIYQLQVVVEGVLEDGQED